MNIEHFKTFPLEDFASCEQNFRFTEKIPSKPKFLRFVLEHYRSIRFNAMNENCGKKQVAAVTPLLIESQADINNVVANLLTSESDKSMKKKTEKRKLEDPTLNCLKSVQLRKQTNEALINSSREYEALEKKRMEEANIEKLRYGIHSVLFRYKLSKVILSIGKLKKVKIMLKQSIWPMKR